jgi:hypothetical protein
VVEIPVPAEPEVIPQQSAPAAESEEISEESMELPDPGDDDEMDPALISEFGGIPPVREKSVKVLMEEVQKVPMVQEAMDLFGGKLTDVFETN